MTRPALILAALAGAESVGVRSGEHDLAVGTKK